MKSYSCNQSFIVSLLTINLASLVLGLGLMASAFAQPSVEGESCGENSTELFFCKMVTHQRISLCQADNPFSKTLELGFEFKGHIRRITFWPLNATTAYSATYYSPNVQAGFSTEPGRWLLSAGGTSGQVFLEFTEEYTVNVFGNRKRYLNSAIWKIANQTYRCEDLTIRHDLKKIKYRNTLISNQYTPIL